MGRDCGRDGQLSPDDADACEAEIRALRARSNAAIAARDIAAMKALFLPDATVLPAASGAPQGMGGFDARMARAFADPDFLGWERLPDRVLIAESGERAAESGRWTGRWRDRTSGGVYQTMWERTADGWRIRNESFVALD